MKTLENVQTIFADVRKTLNEAGLGDTTATAAIVRSLEVVAEVSLQQTATAEQFAAATRKAADEISGQIAQVNQLIGSASTTQHSQFEHTRRANRWLFAASVVTTLACLGSIASSAYVVSRISAQSTQNSAALVSIEKTASALEATLEDIRRQNRAIATAQEELGRLQSRVGDSAAALAAPWQLRYTSLGTPYAAPANTVISNPGERPPSASSGPDR